MRICFLVLASALSLFAQGTGDFAIPRWDGTKFVQVAKPWSCATVSFSATPTFDARSSNCFEIELTGNVTSSTLSNESGGSTLLLRIEQDATGGRSFVFPPEVEGVCAVATGADKVTYVVMGVHSAGAAITGCYVPSDPDGFTLEHAAPGDVSNPPAGTTRVFANLDNSGAISQKTPDGTVTALNQSGGADSNVLVYKSTTDVTTATGSTVLTSYTIPAATIQAGDRCKISAYLVKNGTTDGAVFTVTLAGQTIAPFTATLNGNNGVRIESDFYVNSNTEVEFFAYQRTANTWAYNHGTISSSINFASTNAFTLNLAFTLGTDTVTFKWIDFRCIR